MTADRFLNKHCKVAIFKVGKQTTSQVLLRCERDNFAVLRAAEDLVARSPAVALQASV